MSPQLPSDQTTMPVSYGYFKPLKNWSWVSGYENYVYRNDQFQYYLYRNNKFENYVYRNDQFQYHVYRNDKFENYVYRNDQFENYVYHNDKFENYVYCNDKFENYVYCSDKCRIILNDIFRNTSMFAIYLCDIMFCFIFINYCFIW